MRVQEFLIELQSTKHADYGELAAILVQQAHSQEVSTRLTALRWLSEFVKGAKEQLLPQYAAVLRAVLPNISHPNYEIAQVGRPGACLMSIACACLYDPISSLWRWIFKANDSFAAERPHVVHTLECTLAGRCLEQA